MKKLIIFVFIIFIGYFLNANNNEQRRFTSFLPDHITGYNEFNNFLEQITNIINDGEYNEASLLLYNEINKYNINTHNAYEFEKIITLILIDAAIDYFLHDKKQQGINKQYIVFYLLNRHFSRIGEGYSQVLSFINYNNINYPRDSLYCFSRIIENLPTFNFCFNQDLNDFYNFQYFLRRYYNPDITYNFNYNEFYSNLTIDNYIENFNMIEFLSNVIFTEEERSLEIVRYYYEDNENRWFYNSSWNISNVLSRLLEDLIIMKDFSEDIQIESNSIFTEDARRIADSVDARINVTEIPNNSIEGRSGPTHEMAVSITFKKYKAELFINQYYENR